MTKCLWTGVEFKAVTRGPHEKQFSSDAARAEFHKAARMYTEHLIETGFMSVTSLRAWYEARKNPPAPPCTTRRRRRTAQQVLPLPPAGE